MATDGPRPPKWWPAFIRSRVNGKSVTESATAADVNYGNVRKYFHRHPDRRNESNEAFEYSCVERIDIGIERQKSWAAKAYELAGTPNQINQASQVQERADRMAERHLDRLLKAREIELLGRPVRIEDARGRADPNDVDSIAEMLATAHTEASPSPSSQNGNGVVTAA